MTPGWTTASVEEHRAYAWVADLLLRGWVRPVIGAYLKGDIPALKGLPVAPEMVAMLFPS